MLKCEICKILVVVDSGGQENYTKYGEFNSDRTGANRGPIICSKRHIKSWLVMLVVSLLGMVGTVMALERHVPGQYSTIQAAIDDCNHGDIVLATDRTYVENLAPKQASFSNLQCNNSAIRVPLLYDPLNGSTSGIMTGGSFVPSGTNPWGLDMKQGWCPGTGDSQISYCASASIKKDKGTCEVWMKWHSTDYRYRVFSIIEKPAVRDEESGFKLKYSKGDGVLWLHGQAQDTGGSGASRKISFALGEWYHFAVVWNTMPGEERFEAYVNGLLCIERNHVANIQNTLCTGGEWISGDPVLYRYAEPSCGATNIYDEVAIYDYDKSGSEIYADYMQGRSPHTCTVLPQANMGEIDRIEILNKAPIVLGVDAFQLDVAYYDGDTEKSPPPVGNTTYLSNDPSVGIIDHSGLVTFVGPGLGNFTISYNEGRAEIAADSVLFPFGTPKGGSISAETWSLADSPIVIWDNVSIASGVLSIEPGVEVLCNLGAQMEIKDQAVLNAIGTSNDWISFNANSANRVPGTWVGLRIRENLNPSTFSFARIENCQTGVWSYDGTYSMDHCIITGTKKYAINGQGYGGQISIDHCTFSTNQYPGYGYDVVMIWADESSVTNSIIVNGGHYGLSGRVKTAAYNNVWHNSKNNWYDGVPQGPTDMSEDPMFLNPEQSNYALQALSPCIDMGDPNYPPDPDGTRTDIGAIYFDQSGLPQPDIAVNPASLEFGQTVVGRSSVRKLTISNGGNSGLNIIDVDCDNSAFVISQASFGVIPGDSRTITVTFSPRKQTKYEGLVSIRSNDNDEPLVQVSLRGIGCQLPSGDVIRVPKDYATIQDGLNAAKRWDTVLVSEGIYYENIVWPRTDNVTLRSVNGSMATGIDGSNAEESVIYVGNGQKGVLIEGLTLKNGIGSFSTAHSSIRFGGGILIDECVTAVIRKCRIAANGNTNSAEYCGGVYVSRASNATIDSCEIVNNLGPGIKYRISATDGLIKNCLIAENLGHGIFVQSSPIRICNNTICSNEWIGIYIYTPFPYISNNIIANNNSDGIGSNNTYCSDLVTFNNLWNNSPYHPTTAGDTPDKNGNISVDPVFVGGDPFDYHLTLDSPCIDAATDAGVYTDIEGNVRPFDYPGVDNNGELPEFDMGAYETVPGIEASLKFTPQTLNCYSKGKWIKASFVLPMGFTIKDVDSNTPAKIHPFGIESEYINVFVNKDGLVEIEVGFVRFDFCSAASDYESFEVTAVGRLVSGQNFYGTDTIRIINNSMQYIAGLALHWLEKDCGKPEWCGGFDVNQDCRVDFVDFAMFDGCCIELVGE